MKPAKEGFYWILFFGESTPTIGEFRGKWWDLLGSDEMFSGKEFKVICEVQEPPAAT